MIRRIIHWARDWFITWKVWRSLDSEQRALITGKFDVSDFIEVERPR